MHSAHSENCHFVVWLSWNFAIQTDAESCFLSGETKKFYSYKNIFKAIVNIKTKKLCLLTQFSEKVLDQITDSISLSNVIDNENRSFIIFGHMLWFFLSPKLYLRRPVFPLCALQLDGSSAKKVIKSRVSFFLLLYIALLDCILLVLTVVKVIKEGQ